MATTLRLRRGTTLEHEAFTGLSGEVTIDTEQHAIRIHDGVTPGGHLVAGAGVPAGTTMLFRQAVAPLGWTRDVSPAHDNCALRVVTGAVGEGGSVGFTDAFHAERAVTGLTSSDAATNNAATAGGTVAAATLTVAMLASHAHAPSGAGQFMLNRWPTANLQWATNQNTGTVDANGGNTAANGSNHGHSHGFTGTAHNHTQVAHAHTLDGEVNLGVKYVDFMVASKD